MGVARRFVRSCSDAVCSIGIFVKYMCLQDLVNDYIVVQFKWDVFLN